MIEVNTIYNEDCMMTMSKMPDKFVDLIITSPPYNMRNRIRNGEYTTREKSENFSKKYKYFSDDLPIDDFYKLHNSLMKEMLRVSKLVCYNFQLVTGSKEAFLKILGNFNNYIKDIIIWDKGSGQPSIHDKILNSSYEFIVILESNSGKGRLIENAKFKRGTANNIIRVGRELRINNDHNAKFPFELVRQLMIIFSDKGNLVYDPFMGTGTVAQVATCIGRKFIGSEIVKEYCDMAIKSLSKEIEVKTIPNLIIFGT